MREISSHFKHRWTPDRRAHRARARPRLLISLPAFDHPTSYVSASRVPNPDDARRNVG